MKILVCCSNPRTVAQVESALLGDPDVEFAKVSRPERALSRIDAGEGFDLIIADADTAPTGGFFLAREVKSRGDMGQSMAPVVLLLAREVDRFLAKWSRADAYMTKPPDSFDLAQTVRALVAGDEVPALPGIGSARGDLPGDLEGLEQGASGSMGGPL